MLLAGPEAAHLLEAVGTAPARARTKSRTAINRNRRSVEAALARCGRRGESKIHTFGDFPENAAYVGLRREVGRLFDEDPDFRGACRDMSRQAIAGRLQAVHGSAAPISEEQVCIAVQYVLAELPFFLAAPDILDLDESLMVYHHPWPLGDRIFGGEFPLKVGANHGYLTLIET